MFRYYRDDCFRDYHDYVDGGDIDVDEIAVDVVDDNDAEDITRRHRK